jgi:hypothetical protein
MENTIMAFLEDKNVLGESQGAFRKSGLMNRNNDTFLPIGWGLFKITYGYEQICKRGNHDITTEF